ncbi:MAG TPA: acyl-[ACP]--phospholipid O-acyltransferase [Rickettsiales bacterium]|nr:acyl-[ACP]--phospholipid O-acyltransferase [Rickettsiales bacterium]
MAKPALLASKKFLPLFLTQFLGAFNDNLFKNALVILITYRIAAQTGENAQLLVTLAAGLFILPFFLFSAPAGQMADAYDKATMARYTKIAEIVLMVIAAAGFYMQNAWFLLFVLFCMGIQATFFGPIKYAILPQHLEENELIQGNAYIEAGTFLAILLGTILGGLLVLKDGGITMVAIGIIAVALLGYITSRSIPTAPAPVPDLRVDWNLFRQTWRIVAESSRQKDVFLSILGSSWFWLVGATFLAQFPTFAKDVVHSDETVVTLFLTMFSVGIGLGSMLCNKLLRGSVQATFVPLAAICISLFTIDLYFASQHTPHAAAGALLSAEQFVRYPQSWRILFDLVMMAVSSGVYIVPLYAIMQERSDPASRARTIASNNILNALFMVGSAILTLVMLKFSFTIPEVFLSVAIANGLVAIYICKLLPDAALRSVMRLLLSLLYRVEVKGMENFTAAGDRVLLIANHTSFLDAALIAAYLPEKVTFAVNTHIAKRWWMKPLLVLVDAYALDPTNPLATKSLIEAIRGNRKCMIFPEGRITVTGSLMKVYEGPGMIADKSGAKVLPIRIDGAQYTPLSRLKGKVRIRWFPKITLTVLPPHSFNVPEEIKGRKRRQVAGMQLYDVMSQMMFDSSDKNHTLFASLIHAQCIHGRSHVIAEDIERKPLTYSQFITRSFVLGRLLKRVCGKQKTVGVLLPTSVNTSLVFFGLHAFGRIPAMLNFTAGGAQMAAACKSTQVSTVLTSERFVRMAKLETAVSELADAGIEIVYLEKLRKKITIGDKLFGLVAGRFPSFAYLLCNSARLNDPAVILFTSGSEGTPKGVALSHANIQANRFQLASRVDFGPQDIVFNCLPMFHAFGLTGGTLLPILSGIMSFYYPSPLHYRIIPELIYDTNATILFGTDTFLSAYARMAHPYDLHSVRYVFSGAEKLKEETRKVYSEKFGVRIFEGYGATETAPVVSTNTPMQNKAGTVGRFMPGIEYKLEKVPGIEEGGQLFVKGPNIMLGYFRAEKPGILEPLDGPWYDTGDIVAVDDLGYISIKGRTKRFAKIGGEMVSLTAVESAISKLWPSNMHAVVTVPDAKKGEQIILLTDYTDANRDDLLKHFRNEKINELSLPRKIMVLKQVPLLGTGKVDYQKAKALALEEENTQAA